VGVVEQACNGVAYIQRTNMRSLHASPVQILIRVMKALEKLLKFSRLFIGAYNFTVAKRLIPRTAYMNIIKSMRSPMFMIEGKVCTTVL